MLSLEEFNTLIDKLPFQDYLVTIASKHLETEEWSINNEILMAEVDGYVDGPQFVWLNDWFEGQPFIKIIGFNSIQSIALPNILVSEDSKTIDETMKHSKEYYHKLIMGELRNENLN